MLKQNVQIKSNIQNVPDSDLISLKLIFSSTWGSSSSSSLFANLSAR